MIKILVIDDDRMNCELIQSVFTRHGYQVLILDSPTQLVAEREMSEGPVIRCAVEECSIGCEEGLDHG